MPARRVNTVTSRPPLAGVDDRQPNSLRRWTTPRRCPESRPPFPTVFDPDDSSDPRRLRPHRPRDHPRRPRPSSIAGHLPTHRRIKPRRDNVGRRAQHLLTSRGRKSPAYFRLVKGYVGLGAGNRSAGGDELLVVLGREFGGGDEQHCRVDVCVTRPSSARRRAFERPAELLDPSCPGGICLSARGLHKSSPPTEFAAETERERPTSDRATSWSFSAVLPRWRAAASSWSLVRGGRHPIEVIGHACGCITVLR